MIVPQYWAEARLQHREHRKQVTVRRFGWSDESQQAAQAHADARVQEAMDRILAGEVLPRREHKIAYNGAEGLPIREEVLSRHGDAVITRNEYGARCLNTPDVLFIDIDFDDPGPDARLRRAVRYPLLLAAVVVGFAMRSAWWGIAAALIALVLAHWLTQRIHHRQRMRDGGPEARAQRRIDAFVQTHAHWHLRQYRTPNGFRLLALHRTFDPREPEVKACFDALEADRVFALMCERQHCFRARLSPKPWRIGIGEHLRPRPGVWPINPERLPDRERWVTHYERVAEGYAACRFLRTYGAGPVDARADEVRRLHDDLCRAESGLPLA